MLFGTSNNPMCHIFLILSYVYIFLSESYLSLILFSSCVSSITVSPAMLLPHPTYHHKHHLLMADTPTTEQNNTSHGQSTSLPACPPAAPLLPATSLTSRSLLAARCPTLVLAIAARHLVSHPALINAPPTVRTKYNKVSILCFNWLNTVLAAPRRQLSEMANGMAMVMANGNGNCDGRW
jgi:hypothetical protein